MKLNNSLTKKPTTKQRLEIINFFYHHFIMNYNLKQTEKFFINKKNFNLYQQEIINFIFAHFANIVNLISDNLSNQWSFMEIAHFEKAILIVAVAEFFTKDISKEIIITEAINLVQTFSSFGAYTYVNKVLDNILNAENKKLLLEEKRNINLNT